MLEVTATQIHVMMCCVSQCLKMLCIVLWWNLYERLSVVLWQIKNKCDGSLWNCLLFYKYIKQTGFLSFVLKYICKLCNINQQNAFCWLMLHNCITMHGTKNMNICKSSWLCASCHLWQSCAYNVMKILF